MSSLCFSKKIQHICVSLDVNFNESLTNDVVSFEQLGPDHSMCSSPNYIKTSFTKCDFAWPDTAAVFVCSLGWVLLKKKKLSDSRINFIVVEFISV